MRSIYITLLCCIVSASVLSQTTYDTTYTKEWNPKSESWTYYDRIVSSYENNQLSTELVQIFKSDSWENYNLNAFHYNNGNLIEELEHFWDDRSQEWVKSYRKLFSYNNHRLSQILHQYIFNGVYVNSQREILNYSEDGLLQDKTVQKFEEAWTNFLKYQYYYNTNELIFEENLTYWDDNKWGKDGFMVTYQYDNDFNIIEKIKTKQSGKRVKNLLREEFVYNEHGRLDNHIMAQWNSIGNNWINKNRAVYMNDMNGYIVSMLNQSKSRTKKEWINYLYTDFTGNNDPITGMDIAGGMTFSIYPIDYGKKAMIEFDNPFKETYFVKVMDKNGQLIGSATTNNNEVSIDARMFNRGLYYVELQGRQLFSGKFSIE